jgi:hypothetical protein
MRILGIVIDPLKVPDPHLSRCSRCPPILAPRSGWWSTPHANQAGRQSAEEPDHLAPAQLTADQNLSTLADVVDLKDVFGDVETNGGESQRSGSLSGAEAISHPIGHRREQARSTRSVMELYTVQLRSVRKSSSPVTKTTAPVSSHRRMSRLEEGIVDVDHSFQLL